MTAQIAIMNHNGLAIATDSAVTSSNPSGVKIHNTANKLFSLSKYEPVALMIYQNAAFMGYPWETLIKVYRKKLGQRSFKSLADYAGDFLSYLASHEIFLREETQRDWLLAEIRGYIGLVDSDFRALVRGRLDASPGELTDDELKEIFASELGVLELHLSAQQYLGCYDNAESRQLFVDLAAPLIDEMVIERYGDTLGDDLSSRLRAVALERFLKDSSQNYTGLVFAGFGDDELLPVVQTFWTDAVLAGVLRRDLVLEKCRDVNAGISASIIPFAQSDSVYRFLQGIDPVFRSEAQVAVEKMVDGIASTFKSKLEHLPDGADRMGIEESFAKEIEANKKTFYEQLSALQSEKFLNPVMDTIGAMPKEELASIAEALVNLTSFQTRIRRELETVGGPIDVAVISKGDGFVWIKRKHYFEKDLNPSFFANYYRGDGHAE